MRPGGVGVSSADWVVEDVEREDEHDVEPDHTRGRGFPGRGRRALLTPDLAASESLACQPQTLPTLKPLWGPARGNEDDDEEHLITQGGPGFPGEEGGRRAL